MLSHQNIQASASKRAPPPSLNVKTGSRNAPYDDPSPRTPPSHNRHAGRSKAASKALNPRPALRETFLDDITPVDKVRGDGKDKDGQDERDLHDLSLSPRHVTRDSVVDNMLLSLDQFSTRDHGPSNTNDGGFYSPFDDDDPCMVNSRYATTKGGPRHRGHKYSSSYSSEYDVYADDTSSRYSSHYSRGRRSNSSSNFQSALPRIDSIRTEKEAFNPRGKIFEAQRAAAPGERELLTHSRGGRKGSKSSGSSSLDFGQMIGGSRWHPSVHRRSNSFDQVYMKGGINTAQSKSPPSTHVRDGRVQPSEYDFEAAPTPTVPVAPRKAPSSPPALLFPPQPKHAPPRAPLINHNNSSQPSKYTYNKKGRPDKPATTSNRGKRDHTTDYRDMFSVLPGHNPSAPSPTVNYHKPSVASTQDSMPQAKERPGFFRRVFGSSKNTTPTQNNLRPPQLPPMDLPSSHDTERSESQASQASPLATHSKLSKSPPVRNPPAVPQKDSVQPTLNKKPSLFFRRRKRSVSGIDSPAVLPLHMQAKASNASANLMGDRSPVSSLRKVMNPYLHSPVISPQEFHDSTEQQDLDPGEKDGDHPPGDDEGHGHSFTILPQSRSRNEDEKLASLPGPELASAVGESPSASGKANLNVSRREGQDDSFLQDSSSNDGRSGRTSPNNSSSIMKYRDENTRPSTTPSTPAFVREMLGENQRQRSCEPATGKDVRAVGTNTIGVPKTLSPESQNVSARGLSPKAATGTATDQEWVVTLLKPRGDQTSPGNSSSKSSRVWIQPTASEEQLRESSKLSLLLEGTKDSARASGSSASDYKSATDVPVVQIDDQHTSKNLAEQAVNEAIVLDQNEPTSKDREQAKKVYDGDEEFVTKARAAAWLGESSSERGRVRKAYMELFEWADLNILYALRGLCGKVILKGETQQVDRILDAFSTRWSECNPDHGFKATDVVHTICYSILLLNTDLHLAEIEQKMTRAQFIKNTMPTIRRVAADAAPDAFETIRPSRVAPRPQLPWTEPVSPSTGSTSLPHEGTEGISSAGTKRPTNTLLTRPSDNSEHDQSWNQTLTPLDYDTPHDDCGPLVKAPFNGKMSTWEVQVEIVLKDFFNTIRQQPLPLNGAPNEALLDQPMPTNSLSAFTGSLLRRTPSTLSKAASETIGSRGRVLENRLGTGRWTSKTRSRPRLNPTSTVASSRTSFDDESSMWSPSVSSTWSKYSLGKTQTSMSVDSLGSEFHQADYQQSIGFANALSQAIIREETAGSTGSDDAVRVAPFLEDETLELAGAPWAKEGILKHKHHLEVVDKKAKDRNWNECFAVIEKGYMRLFSFNMNSKSLRQKTKNQRAGGVVGGGNWSENAEALGTFLLRQTIASALPPPGYSKTRPHVWALSLPSGAVHLFQVGTPEIVKEFVSTANYWSARLSKEPLIGGISNIEHGWSNAIINSALVQSDDKPHSTINHCQRPSLQSSIRSSLDQGSVRPKLPGDKGIISDWSPPQQSMVASALMEIDQLKALTTYVKNVEEELQRHNELRGPMLLAFSSRHPNSSRAMANWERKSSYLLKEIVKFRTYIDCLNGAQLQKQKLYASRVPSEQSGEAKNEGGELPEAAT